MSSAGRIPQTCRQSDVSSQRQGSEHVARQVVKRCVRLDSIVTCQTRYLWLEDFRDPTCLTRRRDREAEGTVSAECLALLADNNLLLFVSPLASYDTDGVNVFTRLYKFEIISPWIFETCGCIIFSLCLVFGTILVNAVLNLLKFLKQRSSVYGCFYVRGNYVDN